MQLPKLLYVRLESRTQNFGTCTIQRKRRKKSSIEYTVSSFNICSYKLRGFTKNDSKLEKLLMTTSFQDMLHKHLNQDEVCGCQEQQANLPRISRSQPYPLPNPRNDGFTEEIISIQANPSRNHSFKLFVFSTNLCLQSRTQNCICMQSK